MEYFFICLHLFQRKILGHDQDGGECELVVGVSESSLKINKKNLGHVQDRGECELVIGISEAS